MLQCRNCKHFNIRLLLDCGCSGWRWSGHINLDIYTMVLVFESTARKDFYIYTHKDSEQMFMGRLRAMDYCRLTACCCSTLASLVGTLPLYSM
jgi:hypothetical protein